MKKSKERAKGFVIGFVAAMVISSSIMVAASTGVMREIFFDVTVMLHGEPLELDDDMQPFIMDGRTFLPARIVEQIADMPVNWDGETQTVYIGRMPIDAEDIIGVWRAVRLETIYESPFSFVHPIEENHIVEEMEYPFIYIEFTADGIWKEVDGDPEDDVLYWAIQSGQLLLNFTNTFGEEGTKEMAAIGINVDAVAADVVITDSTMVMSYRMWGSTMIMTFERAE